MELNETSFAVRFAKAESDLLETGSILTLDNSFLTSFANVLRNLSGCDAVELRTINQNVHYDSYVTFEPAGVSLQDGKYITDESGTVIPVKQSATPLEQICRGLIRRVASPDMASHYEVSPGYIADTGAKGGPDLSGTGFGSILVLPFSVYDNSPGMLILYAKRQDFITPDDIPGYMDLMHILPYVVKFRRTILANNERSKELRCLYTISKMFESDSDDIDVLLQKVADSIPAAMQYPEQATVHIRVGSVLYRAGSAGPSTNQITVSISLTDGSELSIYIYYPEPNETNLPCYFRPEEQDFLNLLCTRAAYLVNRDLGRQRVKELEDQLHLADRQATIGKLSSGVAHELNDPLASILGFAQLAQKKKNSRVVADELDRIIRASLQARDIVQKLLLFSKQLPAFTRQVDVNAIINNALDLLSHRVKATGVEIKFEAGAALPLLEADPRQLSQVVVNLCQNAIQAMPQGGLLTISTASDGSNILLNVSDTGKGISQANLSRIFLPFFTTRDIGEGTGLGLSVVQGIVESHQGSINVLSRLGRGSRFEITLPLKTKEHTVEDDPYPDLITI